MPRRLGQHFLRPASVERLLKLVDPQPDQVFLEIGAGTGALTLPLAARAGRVVAIEIDTRLAEGLQVHPEVMRRNLDLTGGLIASEAVMMKLTRRMGRHQAHHLLYEAAQRAQTEGRPFKQVLAEHPAFDGELPDDVLRALEPASYLGESAAITDDVLARVAADRTGAG